MKKEQTDYFLEVPILIFHPIRWGKSKGNLQLESKTLKGVEKEASRKLKKYRKDLFKKIDSEDLGTLAKQMLKERFPKEVILMEINKYVIST